MCDLIVDSDIVIASGSDESTHPLAECCFNILNTIELQDLAIGLSDEIESEWGSASSYASSWAYRMQSRGKIEFLGSLSVDGLKIKIRCLNTSQDECKAMEKDAHLLIAAEKCNCVILSNEKKARGLYNRSVDAYPFLRKYFWLSVAEFGCDEAVEWLENGANRNQTYCLGEPYKPKQFQRK